MAKRDKIQLPGCIYTIKSGNFWWKVKLPGESKIKARPLLPLGALYATKDRDVAVALAKEMWQRACFKFDYPAEKGSIVALIQAYQAFANGYYTHSTEANAVRLALKPLLERFGATSAMEFGPKKLNMTALKKLKNCDQVSR